MRSQLKRAGIPTIEGTTAIVPIFTCDAERTFVITRMLLEGGVYVNPVIPPAVPEDQCLLRTSYTATHTREQINRAVSVIQDVFAQA
jgi:7-keto-8-aminopelargonate synthetase-like enzyme